MNGCEVCGNKLVVNQDKIGYYEERRQGKDSMDSRRNMRESKIGMVLEINEKYLINI